MNSRSRSPHMRSAKLPLFQPYAPKPIFWDRWNAYDIYRILGCATPLGLSSVGRHELMNDTG